MWLEGRFCTIVYPVCPFLSGVIQQIRGFHVISQKSAKDLGKDKFIEAGLSRFAFPNGSLPVDYFTLKSNPR